MTKPPLDTGTSPSGIRRFPDMLEVYHTRQARAAAQAYDRLHAKGELRRPDGFWTWLLAELAAVPGQRLLDVASGAGQFAALAARSGLEVVAVDYSRRALGGHADEEDPPSRNQLQPDGRSAFARVQANGERLPFADGRFDRVTNIGSLEHFADPASGAAEMARVLAPNGLALILLPNAFSLRGTVFHAWRTGHQLDDGQPIQRYGTRGQWARLLGAAGFSVERVLGCESFTPRPQGLRGWSPILRHPSRILLLVDRKLPVNMAAEFIFVCRKAPGGR